MNRSLKMADDINDRKKADIRRHFSKLVKEIPTHDILPHLSQCLFPSDMQTLTRGLRNESNEWVNMKLLEILPYRRRDWWIHLSNALIHIERPDLLVAMGWSTEIQTADQDADTSRRVHDSTTNVANEQRPSPDQGADTSRRVHDSTTNVASEQRPSPDEKYKENPSHTSGTKANRSDEVPHDERKVEVQEQKLKVYKKQKDLLDSVTNNKSSQLSTNLGSSQVDKGKANASKDKMASFKETGGASVASTEDDDLCETHNSPYMQTPIQSNLESSSNHESDDENKGSSSARVSMGDKEASKDSASPKLRKKADIIDDFIAVCSAITTTPHTSTSSLNVSDCSTRTGGIDTQSSRSSNESLHSTFTSSNLRNDLSEARVSRVSPQSLSENNLSDADVSDTPVPCPQQGIETLPTNVTPSPVAEDLSGTVPTPVGSSGTVPTPVGSSNRTGISNPTGTSDEHYAVESSNTSFNTDPGDLRAAVGGRSGVASTERATPQLRQTAVSSIQDSEPSIDLANQHDSISVTGLGTPSLGLPTLNLSNQHDSISLYRVRLASLGLPSLYDIANDSGVRRSVGSALMDAFFR